MRPKLLDLYCGAGGCGMGYHRAGFDVYGVDIQSQPHYPFDFWQADALRYIRFLLEGDYEATGGLELDDIAVIHASPPCQAFSIANNIHGRTDHPDLIGATRQLLIRTGKPYVIENVPGAPLYFPVMVCGLALGLNVKRHRLFESNLMLFGTDCCGHKNDYLIVFGCSIEERGHQIGRTAKNGPIMRRKRLAVGCGLEAMGIDWAMNRHELSQAIPPLYTEFLGKQLMRYLEDGQS